MKHNRLYALLLVAAMLLMCLTAAAETVEESQLRRQYEAAQELFAAGRYGEAYEAFSALGKFEDSRARAKESRKKDQAAQYEHARALYDAEQYDEAKELFKALGDYRQSRSFAANAGYRGTVAKYNRGKELFEAGDYEGAMALFEAAGKYRDSRDRVQAAKQKIAEREQAKLEAQLYDRAVALKAAGDLVAARDLFIEAGDCKDSGEQLYDILHTLAVQKTYAGAIAALETDPEAACVLLTALDNYKDSAEKLIVAQHNAREALLAEATALRGSDPARAFVLAAGLAEDRTPSDVQAFASASMEPIGSCTMEEIYAAADALAQEGAYRRAQWGFELLGEYEDSAARAADMARLADMQHTYEYAKALKGMRETARANRLFATLGDFQDADLMVEPVTEPFSVKRLRDDRTTAMSEVFTAPDGSRHTYRIYKGVHKWVEARAFCEALGGHLATLTTPEENEFVYWYMRGCDKLTAFFGLSDEKRAHNWIWVTGEPVDYTNWSPGQPSYSAKERYGMYFYKHLKGTWNDSHFYEDAEVDPGCSFICEWDID